jgi:hypothetical protein
MTLALWHKAEKVADEVLDNFSALHPHIRMNRAEWQDLHEMIEREVFGHFSKSGKAQEVSASDVIVARRHAEANHAIRAECAVAAG